MTDATLALPSLEEATAAEAALRALDAGLELRQPGQPEAVPIPAAAVALLRRALGHLANGDAVSLLPVHAEVTTQQAAELLGVSRPFLIGLVEAGQLPCRRVGTHRRLPLRDLLAFKEANRAERRAIAAALTAEAEELGLGYP